MGFLHVGTCLLRVVGVSFSFWVVDGAGPGGYPGQVVEKWNLTNHFVAALYFCSPNKWTIINQLKFYFKKTRNHE